MQLQCPCCDAIFNIEEGFTSIEGKQLAALFAELEPPLGKAVLSYLRLFNPAKRGLKLSKAIKVVEDLIVLVKAGSVTRDARTHETKPATIKMWVAGIEQMLEQRSKLTLPLNNHNYLRAIVYGIASDPIQVAALKTKPSTITTTSSEASIYQERLSIIDSDLRLKIITVAEAKQLVEKLNTEFPEYVKKLKEDRLNEQRTATERMTKAKSEIKTLKSILDGGLL